MATMTPSSDKATRRWLMSAGVMALALGAALWLGHEAQGQPNNNQMGGLQNGRFFLVTGQYMGTSQPSDRDITAQSGVFKIDTATGRTWQYMASHPMPGRWVEVK